MMTSVGRRLSWFGLLILTFASTPAAWGQCATGVNTGGGNCVPPNASGMPGYQGSYQPTAPAPVWKDSWGAIVIDSTTGGAGTVIERDSKSQAVSDATRDCESHGATGCKVEMTFHNQCAAVGWGKGGHSAVKAPNKQQAEEDAISSCSKVASECKVVYSDCSVARRVQ